MNNLPGTWILSTCIHPLDGWERASMCSQGLRSALDQELLKPAMCSFDLVISKHRLIIWRFRPGSQAPHGFVHIGMTLQRPRKILTAKWHFREQQNVPQLVTPSALIPSPTTYSSDDSMTIILYICLWTPVEHSCYLKRVAEWGLLRGGMGLWLLQ